MPVSVQTTDNKTNQVVTITDLDDILCPCLGWTPHPEYARAWDVFAELVIAILMQFGGDKVNKEKFDKYLAIAGDKSLMKAVPTETLRKLLYEDYTWKAWR